MKTDREMLEQSIQLTDRVLAIAREQKEYIDKLLAANAALNETITLIQYELDLG